jgi:hypothetical protein
MPILVGMILGIILTIGAALAYDTSTGRAPNGLTPTAAGGNAPMVNWDVVSDNWHDVKVHLQNAGVEVERGWKRIAG